MNLTAISGEAWRAMSSNRLRMGLTMLGIIIGVAAVVLMLAVGQGAQRSVAQSISTMGSNLLIVLSGASTSGGIRFGAGSAPTLNLSDTEAVSKLSAIKAAAPVLPGNAQIAYGTNNWSSIINGVSPEYLDIRDWPLESGRPFTQTDMRSAARVALMGQTVAKNLFGDEDPAGKVIRIRNSPFLVIGLLSPKGQSLDGRDQDDTVLIPVTTAQAKLFGSPFPGAVRYIVAQAHSAEVMDEAEEEINQLLRQRHRLAEGAESDFSVRNLTAIAQTAASTARIMSLMLGAIASISLLVGGIGIMNIMLVSVTERTREIGIRMAIGARRRDILLQFLLEALIICVLGGLIGALLGVGGAWLASDLAGMPVEITLRTIGLAFLFAAGVGTFFGYYPARRASLLRPVEALRYE